MRTAWLTVLAIAGCGGEGGDDRDADLVGRWVVTHDRSSLQYEGDCALETEPSGQSGSELLVYAMEDELLLAFGSSLGHNELVGPLDPDAVVGTHQHTTTYEDGSVHDFVTEGQVERVGDDLTGTGTYTDEEYDASGVMTSRCSKSMSFSGFRVAGREEVPADGQSTFWAIQADSMPTTVGTRCSTPDYQIERTDTMVVQVIVSGARAAWCSREACNSGTSSGTSVTVGQEQRDDDAATGNVDRTWDSLTFDVESGQGMLESGYWSGVPGTDDPDSDCVYSWALRGTPVVAVPAD